MVYRFGLVSEVGELGKELNKETTYGKSPLQAKENINIELEVGDVFYSLIGLSTRLGLKLDNYSQITRFSQRKPYEIDI